jgi:hypothetical protein
MAVYHAAWLFAIAVGFVSAGLVGSIWELATDQEPRLGVLLDPNPTFATPFRVMAAVFAAPITVLLDSVDVFIDAPIRGIPVFVGSLLWSFLQGVFILTMLFGLN